MSNQKLIIRLEPRIEAVSDLLDRLEAYATAADLGPRTAHRLAVVCEELVANVAMHGASGKGGATYVKITIDREATGLHLEVEDDGRPFDPLAEAVPDTALGLEDREIGGLGIHFVRNMVKDIGYGRLDGLNRLTAVLNTVE